MMKTHTHTSKINFTNKLTNYLLWLIFTRNAWCASEHRKYILASVAHHLKLEALAPGGLPRLVHETYLHFLAKVKNTTPSSKTFKIETFSYETYEEVATNFALLELLSEPLAFNESLVDSALYTRFDIRRIASLRHGNWLNVCYLEISILSPTVENTCLLTYVERFGRFSP